MFPSISLFAGARYIVPSSRPRSLRGRCHRCLRPLYCLPLPLPALSLEGHPYPPNSLRIRTSAHPLSQLLYNPHFQGPLGSAGNKGLTATKSIHITLLQSTLPSTARKCGKQRTYNSFGIRTYNNCVCNLFGIRTYKNVRGEGLPRFLGKNFNNQHSESKGTSCRHSQRFFRRLATNFQL